MSGPSLDGVRELAPGAIDLAAYIRPGDTVVIGQASAEPTTLTRALVAQAASLGNITVFVGATFSDTFGAGAPASLAFKSYGGIARNAVLAKVGRLAIVPCHYSQIPALFESGRLTADVVLMQAAPPRHGRGLSCGAVRDAYLVAAARQARAVLVEINDNAPSIAGGELPADLRFDAFVRSSAPLVELAPARAGDTERQIAARVAALVPNGATLQLGIGALPDAILAALGSHRHLGLHSGMLTAAALPLIESGVVDNSQKIADRGVTVAGILVGDAALYQKLDGNPGFRLAEAAETHGIAALSRIPNFISLNSAIEVDITGQVNAEVAGGTYIGGFGGQLDFVRAAAASAGGLSVIALGSATRGEAASRIVASLSGPVTTTSADVDCIVTEWGVAHLKGATFAQRRARLAAIAHPKFRDALAAGA
jgi:acetyl-CoA hydrolase